MDPAAVLAAIRRFRGALEAHHITVERMVLFGSHAEGAGREESDIDVAVISGDFSAQSFWERVRILPDAIYEVGLPIEAVALSPEEWERADRPIVVLLKRGRRSTDSMSLFGGHDGVAFGGGVPGRG